MIVAWLFVAFCSIAMGAVYAMLIHETILLRRAWRK